MQYEPPSVQVLLAPHCPEQQSPPTAQALPAVLHALLSGAHSPVTHEPPQHCASAVQVPASETQVVLVHLLSAPHWKLQQSGPALQPWPSPAQTPTTEAHFWVFGSQTPEQHSGLWTQVTPTAVQVGSPGSVPGPMPAPPSALPLPAKPLSPPSPLAAPAFALVPAAVPLSPPKALAPPLAWLPPLELAPLADVAPVPTSTAQARALAGLAARAGRLAVQSVVIGGAARPSEPSGGQGGDDETTGVTHARGS